jgi:hypothetical protein
VSEDDVLVSPKSLTSYFLRTPDWSVAVTNDRRTIFEHVSGQRAFVPGSVEVDYAELVAAAVVSIAAAESRDEQDVWSSLLWQRRDHLQVRRLTADASVSLATGLEMHEALQDLIIAATRSSIAPNAHHRGRRPAAVDRYVEQVRLIPSLPGSFVVRALLPVEPLSDDPQLELEGSAIAVPEHRAVSDLLMKATRVAVATASAISGGGELNSWDAAVPQGVSSNLCDALARLTGGGSEAMTTELSVGRAWQSGVSDSDMVSIPAGASPGLEVGGVYLRSQSEQLEIRATGLVVKLHRENQLGAGEVTIRGVIEGADDSGRSRTVKVPLDELSYNEAVLAHRAGRPVTARLQVVPGPSGLVVQHVRNWRVIDD